MVEEIKNLCKKNSTSIKALERELGFGNGTIRRWDDSAPSFDKIQKVCDYFGCSISELTGENEQKEKPTLTGEPLPQITQDLFKEIQGLSLEEQYAFRELLQTIKANRGEDK